MQTPLAPKQFTSFEFIELYRIKLIRCVIQDKDTEKYIYMILSLSSKISIKTYY